MSLSEELQLVTGTLSSRYGRTVSSQALSRRASRQIPSRDKNAGDAAKNKGRIVSRTSTREAA